VVAKDSTAFRSGTVLTPSGRSGRTFRASRSSGVGDSFGISPAESVDWADALDAVAAGAGADSSSALTTAGCGARMGRTLLAANPWAADPVGADPVEGSVAGSNGDGFKTAGRTALGPAGCVSVGGLLSRAGKDVGDEGVAFASGRAPPGTSTTTTFGCGASSVTNPVAGMAVGRGDEILGLGKGISLASRELTRGCGPPEGTEIRWVTPPWVSLGFIQETVAAPGPVACGLGASCGTTSAEAFRPSSRGTAIPGMSADGFEVS